MNFQEQIAMAGSSGIGPLAWVTMILLGLGLAASSGLNTFMPLLMLAGAAKFHLFGIETSGAFAWLGTNAALGVLALATIVEIVADKIPIVDHGLDAFGTIARPLAGALAAASVFSGADATTAAVLGLIVGAPVALGVHAAKAGTRAASSATTFGFANPVLSILEDIAAFLLTLTALVVPLLVPLLLIIFGFLFWKLFQKTRRHLSTDRLVKNGGTSTPTGG